MLPTLALTFVVFCALVLAGIIVQRCYAEWQAAQREQRSALLLPAATEAVRYAFSRRSWRDLKDYLKG